jgi:hypothetical protein
VPADSNSDGNRASADVSVDSSRVSDAPMSVGTMAAVMAVRSAVDSRPNAPCTPVESCSPAFAPTLVTSPRRFVPASVVDTARPNAVTASADPATSSRVMEPMSPRPASVPMVVKIGTRRAVSVATPAVTARSSVGSDAGTRAEATARSISPEPAVIACTTPDTNSPPARSPWLARPESSCARSSFVDALTAKRAICASAVFRPAESPEVMAMPASRPAAPNVATMVVPARVVASGAA